MANTITTKYLGGIASNAYAPYSAIITIDTYALGGVTIPTKGFVPTIVVGCNKVAGAPFAVPQFSVESGKLYLYDANGAEMSSVASPITIHLTLFGQVQ